VAEPPFGHESSAVAVRRILSIGGLLAAVVVVLATLIDISLTRWIVPNHSEVVARRGAVPPRPRLQANPVVEMDHFRKEKEALLSSWQWTDQTHAFARIPIDRAMSLYLTEQGHRIDQSATGAAIKPARRVLPPRDLQVRAGLDPRVGLEVPLNLQLREADGSPRELRTVLGNRVTLLVPGYYACANLCGAIRAGVAHAVARAGLVPGKDFNVVLVSIDPRETPQAARTTQHEDAARLPGGLVSRWHYLTGTAAARDALMKAIGFRSWFDARNGEYAHPAALVVLSSQGVITQYLTGVQFDPQALRLAVVDASAGRIGTWVDRFILLCCDYDPSTGHYGLLIHRVLQGLGVATVLALGALLLVLRRRRAQRGEGW